MSYILGYILFFVVLVVSLYIPGCIFLYLLKLEKKHSWFDTFSLSWTLGISLFLSGNYFFSYLKLPFLYLGIILVCSIIFLLRGPKKFIPKPSRINDKLSILLIILGSLGFTSLMFFSGFLTKNGLQFIDVNAVDGIRHIGLIADQRINFPPQQPYLAGQPLKGFHYFYDFMLSRFSLFYSFPINDLYFRYFPLFISFLYGFGILFFINKFTSNKTARRFVLFLAYFSRSNALFIWLFNRSINIVDSAIVQPMGLILNPFTILSLFFVFMSLALFPLIKKSWKYSIIAGIIIGVLSEIKVYSGIIVIGTLTLYCLYLFVRFRKKYIFNSVVILVISAILTSVTFLPNNAGSGGLIFAPLLFYNHYLQTDIFSSIDWGSRLIAYSENKNYLGIIVLYALSIFIFILLNFGLRLILFFRTKNLFSKNFWREDLNFILFCSIFIPIFIGSFFIQSVSVFDTVQFFWIVLSIMSIPTGIVLASIFQKTSFRFAVLTIVILVTLPGIIATEIKYVFNPSKIVIKSQDLKVLESATKIVPQNAFITLLPPSPSILDNTNYVFPSGTPFISSLTKRQVFFEEGGLPSSDNRIFNQRQTQIQNLRDALNGCKRSDIREAIIAIGSPYVITIGHYECIEGIFETREKIVSSSGGLFFYKFVIN